MVEKIVAKPQLRSFGLIMGGAFSVIALWPMVYRGQSVRLWALAIAVAMTVTGLVLPQILRPIFRVWMALGAILGWVNTRIILSLVFYGLILPIAIALRLAHKDALLRKYDKQAASYRIPRAKRPASHMERQF